MAKKSAALNIIFGADTKELDKALGNLGKRLRATSEDLTDVGKNLSIGLTAPIVAFGALATKNFVDSAKALAQVDAAVKSTGGVAGRSVAQLEEMAGALQRMSLFDDDQILGEVTANLLTFTRVTGTEFDKAQVAILDMSTRLGTDLTSASIQVGKALNDPIKGVTALGRAGVQFTAQQKEQIAAMQESGDIAGAQAIILQELETQFGGAAAAAARTDPYTQLANEIGNLSEDFGKIISEALIPLVQFVQRAADAIKGWSDGTKQFVIVAGGLLAVLGPMLIVVGQLIAAYTTISGAIAAKAAAHAAEAAAANTATVAQIKLNLAVLANPYVAVAASILILVGAMVKLYKDTKSAEETIASLREELKDLSAEEASREAEKAVMAQAKRVEELKESYETLSRTRAIGDANDQRMHANNVQRTKEELAKAEEVLGGMRQLQKQKESDAYWSAEATKRMAEMGKKQEEVNVTMGEAVQAQESIQSKLQQRVADIEAEYQVTSDLEEKVNALKDAYLNAAIEAQKLKDVNLSEELYQQFLATGRVEGGAMTPLAPIATPGSVPQVGGATPVPVLQDTTASTQRLNEALNALNAQDALARQAEEAAQFEALMQRLADTALQLGQSFGTAFGQLITGAEGGKDAMKEFASQAIDAAFMAASGFAIQAATQSSLATGPAAAIVLPALITAGLAGLREVFRGITGLATGGLTTGPMLAMIGDNQSGKEAVIPFERMGEFLQMAGVGAQSNQNIVVQGRISGRDILISNQRTGRDANRYR